MVFSLARLIQSVSIYLAAPSHQGHNLDFASPLRQILFIRSNNVNMK